MHPFLIVKESYDDNIFLEREDEKDDFITEIIPGIMIEPLLEKHKLALSYDVLMKFFSKYSDQDNFNHTVNGFSELNFNEFSVGFRDRFRYFSQRAGEEDANRVPRTQNHANIYVRKEFNNMDITAGYFNYYEHYRTDDAIGSFEGRNLTYRDLDRMEHKGEIEAAVHLWPKTSLLLAGDYGTIIHDTDGKPDSTYYEATTGLRGDFFTKGTIEARIGFRGQEYEDGDQDFNSLVLGGTIVENFTEKDNLRLDFVRASNDTVYQDNAFYELSFIGLKYQHYFTERLSTILSGSYQLDAYPESVIEEDGEVERADNIFWAGIKLRYEMPIGLVAGLEYKYRMKDSNVNRFDYKDNIVSASLAAKF